MNENGNDISNINYKMFSMLINSNNMKRKNGHFKMISFKYNVKRNIEQPQRFIPNACVQDQQTSTLLFIYKIDLDQVQQVD